MKVMDMRRQQNLAENQVFLSSIVERKAQMKRCRYGSTIGNSDNELRLRVWFGRMDFGEEQRLSGWGGVVVRLNQELRLEPGRLPDDLLG